MAKIPYRRIPSDDFSVTVEGVDYHPHEGEWVEIRPTMAVADVRSVSQFMQMATDLDAIKGDENANVAMLQVLERNFDGITRALEQRIVDWSWTDNDEQPLPRPGTSGWIAAISIEEMLYLIGVMAGGQNQGDAKND